MSILSGALSLVLYESNSDRDAIEHSENLGFLAVFSIVNPEWETARKHAIKFEMQRMDSAKQPEAFDVG